MRRIIGDLCIRAYRAECAKHHLRAWFDSLILLWQAANQGLAYKNQLQDRLFVDARVALERRLFVRQFIFEPDSFYNDAGELTIDLDDVAPAAAVLSAMIGGPALPSNPDAKPPRKLIALMRKRALHRARSEVVMSPPLSDGFILGCWRERELWIVGIRR
ncbi:hypothetical protein AEYBE204_02315 [Asticcacaulis sp. YBE204]|nr:hypothetical protein AEYBE204_02315 [Asticcacaulis sp. YBE204]